MAPDAPRTGRKKMSAARSNGSSDKSPAREQQEECCEGDKGGNNSMARLLKDPNLDHRSDCYEDVNSDYHPALFSALERYLPSQILAAPRDVKLQFLNNVVSKYAPRGERSRVQVQRDYRERILNDYQPLHKELYTLNPECFFVQSFVDAVNENTEESFKRILSEPSPGVYTFDMFQQGFCELLISEVENFEKWIHATKLAVMRPNTMNKYGVVLDDFGFENMLDKLMIKFIKPLASVLFPDVGGSTLDTHHGFVVEYSKERDRDLGFHVDDSEVTLNVCLGKIFTGGGLFFRGVRCDSHVNVDARPEEFFEYSHVPGQAMLHAGRHRHGANEIISGHRMNLILWCRSAVFRELKKHQHDFYSWCGECIHQKKERRQQIFEARYQEFFHT